MSIWLIVLLVVYIVGGIVTQIGTMKEWKNDPCPPDAPDWAYKTLIFTFAVFWPFLLVWYLTETVWKAIER